MLYYCLTTQPGRELRLVEALDRLGHETVCPLTYRHRRLPGGGRRAVVFQAPLLPRYVVVGVASPDALPQIKALRRANGDPLMLRVLGFLGRPEALPALAVTHLRSLHQDKPVVPVACGLKAGDVVLIGDGPFAGYRVKVQRVRRDRADVLLRMFGSMSEVDVPTAGLELVEAAA